MKKLIFLTMISSFVVYGCAAGVPMMYHKDGATDADLKKDRYECMKECQVGGVLPSGETRIFYYGQNKLAQTEANRLFRMCMEARGWSCTESK